MKPKDYVVVGPQGGLQRFSTPGAAGRLVRSLLKTGTQPVITVHDPHRRIRTPHDNPKEV